MHSVIDNEPTVSDSASVDEFMCHACARQGRTCCQGHDIYVTWGDCLRIRRVFSERNFFEYRSSQMEVYLDQDHDPQGRQYVFHGDGTRRVLKQKSRGDCLFLTPAGCCLSMDTRPLVCRFFPYLYAAVGISGQWDPQCEPARSKPAEVLYTGIAGIARLAAESWHQLLYQEIKWEVNQDEDWIDL